VTARPLRVLLVSANYRPSVGGVERYVEILAGELARRRHEVTVLACRTGGAPRSELADGVQVVRVPASDLLRTRLDVPWPVPEPVTLVRTLRRLLSRADVVNPQDAIYATSVAALALARQARVPSVLTQHVAFVPQGGRALDAAQHAAIRTIGRSARLATRVVSYNPAVAEWASRTWGLDGVQVLPPGVPDAPVVDRDALRAELGLGPDRFVALFVGRDVPKKGLDVVLAAADPAYELLAVTDRPAGAARDGVRIVPFVPPERLRELLAVVDAFVLPSEGEGFPLTLQEALVTGLPCVVTPGPGYERYLRDGEAMPVQRDAEAIRDALRRLAADGQFRAALAARAREAGGREFGVERFAEAYEAAYADAIAQGGGRATGAPGDA
jgi:D-inositol-3-phosphate glycosyltransferase